MNHENCNTTTLELFEKIIILYKSIIPQEGELNIIVEWSNSPVYYNLYYSDEGSQLFDLFYDFARTQKSKEVDVKWLMNKGIEVSDLEQIKFFILDFTREERVHIGLFSSLCEKGIVRRLVERISYLIENSKDVS